MKRTLCCCISLFALSFTPPVFADTTALEKALLQVRHLIATAESTQNYQATYSARTAHEGKVEETLMRYFFQAPDKIRMEIEKPQQGAILLYNPEMSEKVRVRPFPKLRFFVLDYDLHHPRVSSDSGSTILDSTPLARLKAFLKILEQSQWAEENNRAVLSKDPKDPALPLRRIVWNAEGYLIRYEKLDAKQQVQEVFEWTDLLINTPPHSNRFESF